MRIAENTAGTVAERRDDESGAALVEFAIAFPFLLLLLVVIVDFGANYGNKVQLQNASRSTASAAAVADFGPSSTCTLNRYSSSNPTSQQLACYAKENTGLDDRETAVKILYLEPAEDVSASEESISIVVCISAKRTSTSGILSPFFKGTFHHSRSVVDAQQPSVATLAPPAEERPLTADGVTDDWNWCEHPPP